MSASGRVEVTWTALKAFIDSQEAPYNYVDVFGMYVIIAEHGSVALETRIAKEAPPSADQTDFETNYKANADNIPLDEPHLIKTETVSSAIKYVGESVSSTVADTDAKFRVKRCLTLSGGTTEQYAGAANNYSKKWSDRATLFPTPVLLDTESLVFDGINDEVNFGNTFNYDHSNQFSIEMWIKPDNLSAGRVFFAKTTTDANVYGFSLRHNATTGALYLQMRAPSALRDHTFDTALTAGVWQHVILTYNGGSNINGARVYRNAVVGNTPASGTFSSSWLLGQDFMLGSRNTVFEFSGKINQFAVWSKALSASEVTSRYNSGAPKDPNLETFNSDLVTWCPIGSADEGDSSTTIYDNKGSNHGVLVNFSATPYSTDVP